MIYRGILRFSVPPALIALTLLIAAPAALVAQPATGPLTMEGVHQRTVPSAAARGVAGTSIVLQGDAVTSLQNPSTLNTVSGIRISLGGAYRSIDRSQVQQYAPVRYYPNLSLLLEGLTDQIPDPDPDLIGFTPGDSVQRAFDTIGPNWTRSEDGRVPLHAFLAVPLDLGDVRFVAGLGVVEYGDFDFFHQNNNALTPHILSQRPLPMPRPTDNEPLDVDWYQAVRSRDGSVAGYGGAVSLEWKRIGAVFGLSGTYLTGRTNDVEQETARGRLTFLANEFRARPANGEVLRRGQSDFSGLDWAVSTIVRGSAIAAGVVVRPPMTITRSFTSEIVTSGSDGTESSVVSAEDQLLIPWRGTAHLAVSPRDHFTFGLEYEWRPYGRARFTDAGGQEHAPWISSSAFRVGAEYGPASWLALRAGMRREAETFAADGSAIENDPIWFTAYSAGAGFSLAGARLNIAFENRTRLHHDILASAVYRNRDARQVITADLSYTLNWSR
jgi:opacity protein-like surface antigen